MITSQYFNITSDASIFASNRHISNKQHCAVWVKSLTNAWSQIPYNDYDLVNNSIILDTALLSTIYSQVELRVADSQEELGTPVTDISTTASIRDEVIVVADNIDSITTVSENIVNLNNIADNIVKAGAVADNMNSVIIVADDLTNINIVASNKTNIDIAASNITEIQNASANAATATTKASEASASATSANNSAISAYNSSTNASNSEIKANKWADNNYNVEVETGKYSAKHWATVSQNSIGVKVVENISSLKTFNINEANQIEVLGYYAKGDGGGGLFDWDSASTEADNGGTIIQATGITTGRWKRVFSGAVNVKWFGAKGDCIQDDTNAFVNSVLYCKDLKHTLDISECRLYLQTLGSPIDITELEIIGNGIMPKDYEDWNYMSGANNFNSHLAYYQNSVGASCIVSNYNGSVFTGKTFYVRGVGIYCNPNNANSSGFVQTVKPVGEYGDWSRALKGDYKGTTVRFTGSYGIYLYGGLEIKTISNLNTNNNIKQGLYIDFTDEETKCPIEYLEFKNCSFTYSNEDCVHLEHAAKQIKFDNCCLNGSGRHFTGTGLTNILAASNYSHIKYGVRIKPKIGFDTLIIDNCYAEESQGMAYVEGGYVYNIKFTNNILYYINSSYIRFALAITSTAIRTMEIDGSYFNGLPIRVHVGTLTTESNNIYVDNIDITNSIGITTAPKNVFVPNISSKYLDLSGTLGNGTAMTATYAIAKTIGVSGIEIAAYSQVYLITASWQAQNSNSGGAYLFIVTRMPSGVYTGYAMATGSIAGFTSAPTISTDGIISIPLAQYYRSRVTRIDANQTQNMFL